jgi:5-methylcytosine-specific restriction endonuclease McrA
MKKPCGYPACPNLIGIRDGRYCEIHQKKKGSYKGQAKARANQSNPENVMAFKFRSSPQWKELRAHKLRLNPLCEDPHGIHKRTGTTETARQIHHIKPVGTHYHLRATLDNLMSLCVRCHARYNALERQASDE